MITGVDSRGKSVVIEDAIIRRDRGGLVVWGMDRPTVAGDAAKPEVSDWWPAPGGVRVSLFTRAPDDLSTTADDPVTAWPDISDAAGFHASNSVDVAVVISGRIWLEVDDGVEIELRQGDTLVQNGARHRWRNRGSGWPLVAVVIVGAKPTGGCDQA